MEYKQGVGSSLSKQYSNSNIILDPRVQFIFHMLSLSHFPQKYSSLYLTTLKSHHLLAQLPTSICTQYKPCKH